MIPDRSTHEERKRSMSMRTIFGMLVATISMSTTANAVIGLNMQVSGPRGYREFIASTRDSGLTSATRLGGHFGYLQVASGTTDPDPVNVPKIAAGPSWCVLSAPSPCDAGQIRAFGSVDGTSGSMQLFARAEAPVDGYFAGFIGATLNDRITLPAQSSGLPIRLTLGGRHEQRIDQPLTSFPGTDFFYSLTLRRPSEASPPGCDVGETAPPCDVTFVEIVFSSSFDPQLGTTRWNWFANGFDVNGLPTISQRASGQGSGATLQLVLPNPQQPMELTIYGEALVDCQRTAGGICQSRVDASQGAHVAFLGSYASQSGYVYAPEASGAAAWMAGVASLAGIARRRRRS